MRYPVAQTSIIVPSFANGEAVKRVTRLIRENTQLDYELIIVDNGARPRGCVHAYNQGLRAADGDMLVCMNDDCQPQPGWLEPLVETIKRGVWLCCPAWRYARMMGPCMVFSRAAYEFTGGFDERYLHSNADHHFEMVLAEAGKPICQVLESQVAHVADDPLRTGYRKSAFIGNHEELPNTGQYYLDDQAVFESIWQGKYPQHYWPSQDSSAWATDYIWSPA